MCRLFGMTTGGPRVHATFWLLDAPDSLRFQSRRMPDGTGLGWFSLGEEPVRDRAPVAAFQDCDFNSEARHVVSHTFISHVRYASTGAPDVHNSHPFVMNDRLFAHNGVVRGLDVLGSWLTDVDRALMQGETDSEMVFAYINFGGEQSGHLIFLDHNTTGDGLISGLQVLSLMKRTGRPLSDLAKCMKSVPQILLNVQVKEKPDLAGLPEVQRAIQAGETRLNGTGRVLVRYSGTEPKG